MSSGLLGAEAPQKRRSSRLKTDSKPGPASSEPCLDTQLAPTGRRRRIHSSLSPPTTSATSETRRYPKRTLGDVSPDSISEEPVHPSKMHSSELQTVGGVRVASASTLLGTGKSDILRRREDALDRVPVHLVLAFCVVSDWARLRFLSPGWLMRVGADSLRHMAMSLKLPLEPQSSLFARLVAVDRVASPKFKSPAPSTLIDTPEGGGIWCLELHTLSNLIFVGMWGVMLQPDLIRAYDVDSGSYVGSLLGHQGDVKCLQECGTQLYSGSYDGTARCWDVTSMDLACSPFISNKGVLSLVATQGSNTASGTTSPGRLFTGHEDGVVRCWNTATSSVLWKTAHSGPATALALRGDSQIITACTCMCYNGSGFSLRILNRHDGRYVRRLGDDDWSPRKTVSFLHPVQDDKIIVGFAAPLGTVANGAVAKDHEIGRVLPTSSTAANFARLKRIAQQKRDTSSFSSSSSSSSSSSLSSSSSSSSVSTSLFSSVVPTSSSTNYDDSAFCNEVELVNAPAWGVECITTHAGAVLMGTDNGLVVVCDASGTQRRRIFDAGGSVPGARPNSLKVSAIAVIGTDVFVAFNESCGDKHATGFKGKLVKFNFAPDALPSFL